MSLPGSHRRSPTLKCWWASVAHLSSALRRTKPDLSDKNRIQRVLPYARCERPVKDVPFNDELPF